MKKIDHINIVVRDLAAAQEFFMELGFFTKRRGELEGKWMDELTGLKNVRAEHVTMALNERGTTLELISYYTPKGAKVDKTSDPHALGLRHIALEVADIEAEVTRLKAKGIRFLGDIQHYHPTRKKLCYFLGPEDVILELAEYS
jgi:catechol 2,3-dioxygenase-like lactoylglutathione lyase family enzyme